MRGDDGRVCLWLTTDEADELLSRCLQSEESDTPTFRSALLQLARAAFRRGCEEDSFRDAA